MDDSTYRFRTALGGFHKGDVLGFIEKIAAHHRSELLEREKTITTLREENRSLQQQLNLLMMATPTAPAPEPAPEPAPAPVPEPAPLPTDADALMTMELQAYRRAEAVERHANHRARKLYQQLEDVCADTRSQFQDTDASVRQTIEAMLEQAKTLEQTYQALSAALDASREKLAIMDSLLTEED